MKEKWMDRKLSKLKNGTTSHQDSMHQVKYLESLFRDADVKISEHSFLFKLIKEIKENYTDSNTLQIMLSAFHLDRITRNLHCLENLGVRVKYLRDLTRGTLDFMVRKPSHAKNILWELDVLNHIKPIYENVYLDEPDIVVPFKDGDIGISCKKIYSSKGIRKVFSKAVNQVESNSFKFGIVALNIDDFIPEQEILSVETLDDAVKVLSKRNMEFLKENERYFLKYLKESRIIAVYVATTTIIYLKDKPDTLGTFTYWTVWTLPDIKKEHKEKFESFNKLFI